MRRRRPYITDLPAAKRPRRGWPLIAAFALLFQAVVPTYAMARVQSEHADLIPVCTGSGIIYISLDDGSQPLPPDPPAQKPCHFCLSHSLLFAIPQAVSLAFCGIPSKVGARPLRAEPAFAKARNSPQPIRAPPLVLAHR